LTGKQLTNLQILWYHRAVAGVSFEVAEEIVAHLGPPAAAVDRAGIDRRATPGEGICGMAIHCATSLRTGSFELMFRISPCFPI
jgi:hypothetical protein